MERRRILAPQILQLAITRMASPVRLADLAKVLKVLRPLTGMTPSPTPGPMDKPHPGLVMVLFPFQRLPH